MKKIKVIIYLNTAHDKMLSLFRCTFRCTVYADRESANHICCIWRSMRMDNNTQISENN